MDVFYLSDTARSRVGALQYSKTGPTRIYLPLIIAHSKRKRFKSSHARRGDENSACGNPLATVGVHKNIYRIPFRRLP
jgi:hypothetical protein